MNISRSPDLEWKSPDLLKKQSTLEEQQSGSCTVMKLGFSSLLIFVWARVGLSYIIL